MPADTVTPPSAAAAEQARARQAVLTKPAGALGRLEDASVWMAAVQDRCPPRAFTAPALVILAGDHGVARATSAYPPEVTAQMVVNLLAGGAAANVLAARVGARVRVVDVSVDADPGYLDARHASVTARRIRRGTGCIDREDAMTLAEATASVALGAALADEEIDAGADVLIAGDMGIGNTTPSSALVGVLAGVTAESVVGRGTGIDDAALLRKTSVVRAAMARATRDSDVGDADDPVVLLARIGGPDIAAMAGFLARVATRGRPAVLDGIVSCAAALVAERMAPGAVRWWAAGHRSTEPAASVALDRLGLDPLVDLGLRLGEGTGALLALPMLDAAAATLADMATFASAGVSDREPGSVAPADVARSDGDDDA